MNKSYEQTESISKKIILTSIIYYSKKYWKYVLILAVSSLLAAIAMISIPLVVNKIVTLISSGNYDSKMKLEVTKWILIIVSLIVISALFTFIQTYAGSLFGSRVEIDLRTRALNKLLDVDMSFYQNSKSGEILTKLIADTYVVGDSLQSILGSILSLCFEFVGAIIVIFILNWIVGIAILIFAVLILVIMAIIFSSITNKLHKARKVYIDINGIISDRMSVITLIKSFHSENYERNRIKKFHNKYYETNKKAQRLLSLTIAFAITALWGLTVVSLVTSFVLIIHHSMPAVKMISIGDAVGQLVFPLIEIASVFGIFTNTAVSLQRIYEIINIKGILQNSKKPISINTITEGINFQNVTFRYPVSDTSSNNLVLNNFSYHFKNHHSYAIVGPTGAGKSTIIRLLLRFYDPTSGSIVVNNNISLPKIDIGSYLNMVGYIEQEPQIIFGTIYDNIKYGNFNATHNAIIEAAQKAKIHDFIMGLPKKYNTVVGERGIVLSGGQKQRIVIARMFLKNPQILVMDEATSSLDNIVEKNIQQEINKLMKNRLSIIVAHRLSTIKDVDQIIVIGKTGIIQKGTFNELIKIDGFFKKFYSSGLIT